MTRYAYCEKCEKVISYGIDEESGETTFPRGEWLVHKEFIVTGLHDRSDVDDWINMRGKHEWRKSESKP